MNILVDVRLTGISPLLMHRYPMEDVGNIATKTKEEQAEISAYRIPGSRELYVPGTCVRASFCLGGKYVKGKGRATQEKPIAACVIVNPEYIGLGTDVYAIDSRPIVNPSTGGRVVRHRPMLMTWQLDFEMIYDDQLLSEKQIREAVDAAGLRVGLLDFRPDCKGPFGRFRVDTWTPRESAPPPVVS